MRKLNTAIPEFDDVAPWGRHAPPPSIAARLALTHRLPAALGVLAKLLRRPIRNNWSGPIDLKIWGLRLRLMPRGNYSEQKLWSAPQLFDRKEFAVMRRLLGPGSVFVDVGANAGAYSFWAWRCMQGQGRIIAVEPDPEMLRRLRFNIATNGLDAIRVFPLALSDHVGVADLQVNPNQRGSNTLDAVEADRSGGARKTERVQITTLLDLVQGAGLQRIDVLKLDIEGHEPTVLRPFLTDAPDALLPRAVITEFKAGTGDEILSLMQRRGYRPRKTTRLNMVFER